MIARIKRWFKKTAARPPFDWADLGYSSLQGAIKDQEKILMQVYARSAPRSVRERQSREREILAICERIWVFKEAQTRTTKQ